MKIKVCGMRNVENISAVAEGGIDLMGFIFYPKSKRYIDKEKRTEIFKSVPTSVEKVGVFVNESLEEVIKIVQENKLDYVQLHGDESPVFCIELKPYAKVIKAFRVDEEMEFELLAAYQDCDYFLFDAKGKEYGGNGIQYNWDLLKKYNQETPFLLSGGIGPEDVGKILDFEHPKFAGIDINSGFEIEPGLKDIEKINSFISNLRCNTQ